MRVGLGGLRPFVSFCKQRAKSYKKTEKNKQQQQTKKK